MRLARLKMPPVTAPEKKDIEEYFLAGDVVRLDKRDISHGKQYCHNKVQTQADDSQLRNPTDTLLCQPVEKRIQGEKQEVDAEQVTCPCIDGVGWFLVFLKRKKAYTQGDRRGPFGKQETVEEVYLLVHGCFFRRLHLPFLPVVRLPATG